MQWSGNPCQLLFPLSSTKAAIHTNVSLPIGIFVTGNAGQVVISVDPVADALLKLRLALRCYSHGEE